MLNKKFEKGYREPRERKMLLFSTHTQLMYIQYVDTYVYVFNWSGIAYVASVQRYDRVLG